MLEHKNVVGKDASIHFLLCSVHFFIGLVNSTEKAVKREETSLKEVSWSVSKLAKIICFQELCMSRSKYSQIDTKRRASDVFGPRDD